MRKKRTVLYLLMHILVIGLSISSAIITDSSIVRWTQIVCAVCWTLCLFIEIKQLIKKKTNSEKENDTID